MAHTYSGIQFSCKFIKVEKNSNIFNRTVIINNYFFTWNASVREWDEPLLFELPICQDCRKHLLYLDRNQLGVLKHLHCILTWLQFQVAWSLYYLLTHSGWAGPFCCAVFSACGHIYLLDCKPSWGKRWDLVSPLSTDLEPRAHPWGGALNWTPEVR